MVTTLSTLMAVLLVSGLNPDKGAEAAAITSNNVSYIGFQDQVDYDIITGILSVNGDLPLSYYVVSNAVAQKELLPVFVRRFKRIMATPRIPEKQVRAYWNDIFNAPVQIFVFGDSDKRDEDLVDEFCGSDPCCQMVMKALEYDRGFLWMGIMSIVEDEIKQLLHVPEGKRLIATIFFGDQKLPVVGYNIKG
jgi:hypothetical protein